MDVATSQLSLLRNPILFIFVFAISACTANSTYPTIGNNGMPPSDKRIDSASRFVVIDRSEPSFIVFTGIPETLDEEKIEEIRQKVSSKQTYTMLSWMNAAARQSAESCGFYLMPGNSDVAAGPIMVAEMAVLE